MEVHQQQLPKLPVPQLESSCQVLLKHAGVLSRSSAEFSVFAEQAEDILAIGSSTRQAYDILLKRRDSSDNWLSDWWLRVAYLGFRESNAVHSNPTMVDLHAHCVCINSLMHLVDRCGMRGLCCSGKGLTHQTSAGSPV